MQAQRKGGLSVQKLSLLVILFTAFGLVCVWTFASREPEYKGRTISVWLKHYPKFKQHDWREAEAAMRAFGTNNISRILKAFTEHNSSWQNAHGRLWLSAPMWLKKIIGPPDLRRLDTTYAPEIFAAIGPSSIPALTEALKDQNPTIQMAASHGLGYFGVEAGGALADMHRCLANAPTNSRLRAVVSHSIRQIEPRATR